MQMFDGNVFIPLSPPTSPRMSLYSVDSAEVKWQLHDTKPVDHGLLTTNGDMALVHAVDVPGLPLDIHRRPLLQSHKTFPYTLNRSGHSTTPMDSSGNSPAPTERITMSKLEDMEPSSITSHSFGINSAPASPVSRLTPPSTSGDKADATAKEELMDEDEDEDEDAEIEEDDQQQQQNRASLTAQELRAQKRKMKRFR